MENYTATQSGVRLSALRTGKILKISELARDAQLPVATLSRYLGGSDSLAIEVKASTRWSDSDLGGLRAFLAGAPRCRGGILAYGGRDAVALGERLFALPMALLLG